MNLILHYAEVSPTYAQYYLSLPELAYPEVKLDCSIPSLSIKVSRETSHVCRCSVLLKAVHIFDLVVPSSFAEYRGGRDDSCGKSIPIGYIHKCV